MLSLHERRALADIEEHLRASDPSLADQLEHSHDGEPPRHRRVRSTIGLAGLVLGALLLAPAVATRNADVVLLAAIVVMTDAAWWTTLSMVALIKSRTASGPGRQRL